LAALPRGEDGLGAGVEIGAAPTRAGLDRHLRGTTTHDLAATSDRETMRLTLPITQRSPAISPRRIPWSPRGGALPGAAAWWRRRTRCAGLQSVQHSGPYRCRARSRGGCAP
jgi:hypothetical protein